MNLTTIAITSITIAVIAGIIIIADLLNHPQKMWIMNLVWPLTCLYAGPLALLVYFKIGRNIGERTMPRAGTNILQMRKRLSPFW